MRALRAVWRFLVRVYATTDPRSLGVFRVALGVMLFCDVARRLPDLDAHYTNAGWLTNHFSLFRPMSSHLFSVYHAFGTPGEVHVLFFVHLFVNLALVVGWHTRLMHVLAAVLITSLNSRNIMLENGGWVVLHLITVWTVVLPLGDRFSVDAFRRSLRERREGTLMALEDRSAPGHAVEPIVALAVLALIAQWAVIYYFNVVHKTGAVWHDGTAVYYFFQQDRMVTQVGVWVRNHTPLGGIKLLTWGTLCIEASMPVLLLSPLWSRWTRKVAWVLALMLHGAIDAVVQLGPFSWAMMTVFLIFLTKEDWASMEKRLRGRLAERVLYVDESDGFSLAVSRIVKRVDWLELVRFLPVPADDPTLSSFTVSDPTQTARWTGAEAIVRLCDSFWFPKLLVAWVKLPGLRGLVDRRVARWVEKRGELTELFGLEDLPGSDEQAPPSEARQAWRTAGRAFGNVAVLLLMVACGSQVLIENRAVPDSLKPKHRPDWMTAAVVYPRLFQGWSMFAPSPPMEDGRMVVDGRTADGRKLDPFTGSEPSFEVQPQDGFRMNQLWGDFHRRIGEPRFGAYLQGVRDMLMTYHEITGRPRDRLVAFDLWYVTESIPPPGAPRRPANRRKLLSQGTVR